MTEEFSWGRQYVERRRIEERFPSVFSLPIESKPSKVLFRHLRDGLRVLDVGAGPMHARDRIRERFPSIEYSSLDVDRAVDADHRSVGEIREKFNRVLLFEVLEHLSPEAGIELLRELFSVLVPGGKLLVTTPNVFHPTAYLRDMTHRTPLAYDELGGMIQSCGYRVLEVLRIHNSPWVWKLLRRTILEPVHRVLGIDYARSVMIVGER